MKKWVGWMSWVVLTSSTWAEVITEHSVFDGMIAVSGLHETTKVLHITDSHISVIDPAESQYHGYSARMDNAYTNVTHYQTGQPTTGAASFTELMTLAQTENVDLLALTGDIVNNPSLSSVSFVHTAVQGTGISSMYTAGNHDWHYEGMAGSLDSLRLTWINNSLLPLYGGDNPLYSSRLVGGINFVAIDNSTYQVNAAQLAFFNTQSALDIPMVLLLHLPIYMPADASTYVRTCGDPRWGWDADNNYVVEQRDRWPVSGNSTSTVSFVDNVKSSTNLVAILCGHTHSERVDLISDTAVQYCTAPAVYGQHRLVTFEPIPLLITSTPPESSIEVGDAYTYIVTTTNVSANVTTLSAEVIPSWLDLTAGVLSGTPSVNDIGDHLVTLRVSDTNDYREQTFTIGVSATGNDAPVITSTPETGVITDQSYSYTFTATDADHDSLTVTGVTLPSWLTLNGMVLSGMAPAVSSQDLVELSVSDGTVSVTQMFHVVVLDPPILVNLVLNPSFEDDVEPNSRPDHWGNNGNYSRSSTEKNSGTYAARGAGNGGIGGISQPINLQPNTDYNLSVNIYYVSGTGIVVFDTQDTFDPQGTQTTLYNPNGGWTTYTSSFNSGVNASVTLRTYTASLSNGVFYIDDVFLSTSAGVNVAPVMTSIPITNATVDQVYTYTVLAADANGDALTFSSVTIPPGFNLNGGTLSGTPTATGDLSVELKVEDGQGSSDTQSFTITGVENNKYDTWVWLNGIIGGPFDDDNGNGLDNLSEYAVGEKPMITKSGATFDYVHQQRTGDPALTYTVELSTNLVSGGWSTNGYTITGTNVTGGTYDDVTNSIPTTGPQSYIRLKVTNE